MLCPTCNKMFYACTCSTKDTLHPPPPLNLTRGGSVIGTIDSFGNIRAPGQAFDNMKADPFGNIPGSNFHVGPGGMITPK
jgi:hypothetical protein